MLRTGLACLATLTLLCAAHAELATTNAKGQITSLLVAGEYMDVQTNIRVPIKGWGKQPSLTDARDVKVAREEGKVTWTGTIELEPGKAYAFTQTLTEAEGAVQLDISVTAQADVDIEGVFLWLDVPVRDFQGGPCSLDSAGASVVQTVMPLEKPEKRHFCSGTGDSLSMAAADDSKRLRLDLSRPIPIVVQDDREWSVANYTAFSQLAPSLKAGETTSLTATLTASGIPDGTPAHLTVDAETVRYRLDGFGGNYCFGIESPVTQYTLQNLRIAWARTEMTLDEWEPQNDDASPETINWEYLKQQDKDGSNLRREFELARQIQDMGVPYVISVWHLPSWLYNDPNQPKGTSRRTVPAEKWQELLECIGSYLLHAKQQYGVEPDLFCFNEANIGVYVYFSPEEHREAIKSIGAYLEKLGLKTKMLLADATGPRGTHTYAIPASEDPEAMKYVTAVAFHSWGGGTPEDYTAWGDLAEKLKLPLLVTELGVDAGAWRTRVYDTYLYAVQEARMYQELLLYARPQGTMQWEFTNDYSIVGVTKGPDDTQQFVPTARSSFVRHFCNLTPYHSEVLSTASDNAKVLITAIRGEDAGKPAFTAHILNYGAARQATVTGLPQDLGTMRAVTTGEGRLFSEQAPVKLTDGSATVSLEPYSLLTLTTIEGG